MEKVWIPALGLSLLALASIAGGSSDGQLQNYIVMGEVAYIGDVPYQAVIYYKRRFFCGGAIVAPIFVITAAHCLSSNRGVRFRAIEVAVRVGAFDASFLGEDDQVADTLFFHQNYTLRNLNYDVGLIRLIRPLAFGERVSCIPLAPPDRAATAGAMVYVTGYGKTHPFEPSPPADQRLRGVMMTIHDHEKCRIRYFFSELRISDRMFCATSRGQGPCNYDSGGPAVLNGELLGLVSVGSECADLHYPSVYTYIPSVHDWITDTMRRYSMHDPLNGKC